MAQRWSVKEDYIVCKYTYEKKAMALYEEGYAELSLILKETNELIGKISFEDFPSC